MMFLNFLILTITIVVINGQKELACAGVSAGNYVRNSQSCQSYYYCDGKTAQPGICPPNLYFNGIKQICDNGENVDCNICSPFGIQHIEDPNESDGYAQCVNGKKSFIYYNGGLSFDRLIGDCNILIETSNSNWIETEKTICSDYQEHVRIGDAKDCSYFYTCLNGNAYRKECAPGLKYNAHIGQCQLPNSYDFCQHENYPIIIPGYDDNDTDYSTDEESNTEGFIKDAVPIAKSPPTTQPPPPLTTTNTAPIQSRSMRRTPLKLRPLIFPNYNNNDVIIPSQVNPYKIPPTTTTTTTTPTPPTITTAQMPTTQLKTFLTNIDCSQATDGTVYQNPYTCRTFIRCMGGKDLIINCKEKYYWHQNQRKCTPIRPSHCLY